MCSIENLASSKVILRLIGSNCGSKMGCSIGLELVDSIFDIGLVVSSGLGRCLLWIG
jgi:hypothetical protein